MRYYLICALAGIAFCVIACHKSKDSSIPPLAKGARHLGIHITQAENQSYGQAFTQAAAAGIDCVPFTIQWTTLEVNGSYDPQGLLDDLNDFYGTEPVSISLCISPIAANRRDLPSDLLAVAFDDSAMIHRFEKLLDTVYAHVPKTNIRYLLIGNEVDNGPHTRHFALQSDSMRKHYGEIGCWWAPKQPLVVQSEPVNRQSSV